MIKNRKLTILENIQVDKSLPKYQVNINKSSIITSGSYNFSNVPPNEKSITLQYLEYLANEPSSSLYLKLKLWLYRKLYKNLFDITSKKQNSVVELKQFFDDIKSNISELDFSNITEIINKYESVLKNAKYNNQFALCEKLEDYSKILKYELILTASEFNKFLNEDDIIKFHDKASRHEKYNTNLCLTYIKNFVKIIPQEVSDLKIKADGLKVFDNYVILHYDYDGKSTEDTKSEKERKKDPILFGIIENSKRLYYIGDWIDEYCDLTLDVLIKTIGIDERKLNTDTVGTPNI